MERPSRRTSWMRVLSSWRLLWIWLAFYYAVYVVWFVLMPDGSMRTALSDFAYVPPQIAGVAAGVMLFRTRRDLDRRVRASWALVTIAIGCRLFADTSWWWLEGVGHLQPFPGLPDVGYVAFYPFLLAGLLLMARSRKTTGRERLMEGLDVLVISASAFVAVWYFALGPVVVAATDTGLAEFLDVYYPVADVVLVAAAARVMIRSVRSSAMLPLLVACLLLVGADTAYPYLSEPGSALGGAWLDLLWVGSVTATAAAVDVRRRARSLATTAASRPPSLVPLFAVVIAGMVLVRAVLDLPSYPVLATAVAVVIVMSLTALRQMIANRQYASLAARYRLLATRDALTGVASRAEGMARGEALLRACVRRGEPCGVLMMDLDRFKQVNDQLGHPVGDEVLTAVAARITAATREQDLVFRYGGDEFLVVLPGADPATTNQVAQRISVGVASGPVTVDGHVVPMSVTVGAASATDKTLDGLIRCADDLLRWHKSGNQPTSTGQTVALSG